MIWNNIEWTPEQIEIINQIYLDAAKELADAEHKWHDRLNDALIDVRKRLEDERIEREARRLTATEAVNDMRYDPELAERVIAKLQSLQDETRQFWVALSRPVQPTMPPDSDDGESEA